MVNTYILNNNNYSDIDNTKMYWLVRGVQHSDGDKTVSINL